ncbi:hypothetical protein [Paenibacillus aestuarii]|uniref:Uncharacterized protein n=1 Tax=Paenibacillus aestuarii TaxID=516965 RepID=A0ABW0K9U7_9BACL|nr:hypothetical protein [Paenibacillus aestuarii]
MKTGCSPDNSDYSSLKRARSCCNWAFPNCSQLAAEWASARTPLPVHFRTSAVLQSGLAQLRRGSKRRHALQSDFTQLQRQFR